MRARKSGAFPPARFPSARYTTSLIVVGAGACPPTLQAPPPQMPASRKAALLGGCARETCFLPCRVSDRETDLSLERKCPHEKCLEFTGTLTDIRETGNRELVLYFPALTCSSTN